MFPKGLYLVVSDGWPSSPEEQCRAGLEGGARVVQLRLKEYSRKRIFEIAERLRSLTSDAGAWLIINDHADIAAAVDADGVHLGQDDLPIAEARKVVGPHRIIGISTHSLEQALSAYRAGADYIGFGPVFPTATKDAGAPRGVDALREVVASVPIPVVAIGGISRKNITQVMFAGACGAAVISDIAGSSDMKAAVAETINIINHTYGGLH